MGDKLDRRSHVVEAILALLLFIGGLTVAVGTSTPAARIASLEATEKDHEARINKMEQKLDDVDAGVQELLRRTR